MTVQPIQILEKFWKPGTNKYLTFGILSILLFFGTFFYLYVSQNYSYLVERNFRLLTTWGQELTETFENYGRSFRFRVQEQASAGLTDSSSSIRSRGLEPTITDEGLIVEGFDPILDTQTESSTQDKTSYKRMMERQTRKQLSLLPFVKNVKPPESPPTAKPVEDSQQAQPPTVTFFYAPHQPNGQVEAKASDQDGNVTATASIALGDLLKHVATERIYEDVLLIDPSGSVVYQRNPSTLKFLHLGNLVYHQRVENGWLSGVLTEGGLQEDKTLDLKNLSQVMKTAMPAHFEITVGGNSYDVFMQAVAFPSIKTPEPYHDIPWIICGLLPSTTFQEQYLAIPFTVLLFCLFVFVSAFLALPFFSLLMMSPRERLTRFSVVSLLITNILGAGIGTLFLLDWNFYRQSVADFQDRITMTADTMTEAFNTQLDRMVWQLDYYNQQFRRLKDQERFPTNPDSKAWLARVNLPDPCQDMQGKTVPLCYPNFSVAFWVDGGGILRETWTQAATPYVRGTHDLRQRDYVTQVQTSSRNLYRRLIDNRWMEFYIQPLISLESSTRSVVISQPYSTEAESETSFSPWVAALQSEDFSLLKEPVLSPGSGYAVIEDQTGLALFHSNGRRMLRENFIEETDNNPEITALIHARAEGQVEGDYWGSGHRFALKPLPGLPWTLVVFESKETFRTTNFEILIFSLSLFTLYILALLLWIKVVSLFYRENSIGQRVRWTWPKQGLRGTYQRLSLFQMLLFLLGLVTIWGMDWQEVVGISSRLGLVVLPFLSMWVMIRTVWKGKGSTYEKQPETDHDPWALLQTSQLIGAFARFGLTSFLLLGVFPSILFFKVAHDQEMRLFAQHHLWDFARTLTRQTHGPWLAKGTGENSHDFQFLTSPTECLLDGCGAGAESAPFRKSESCAPWANEKTTPYLQDFLHNVMPSIPFPTCIAFDGKTWNPRESIELSWFDRMHRLIRKSSLDNPMNNESWGFLFPPSTQGREQWNQTVSQGHQQVSLRINDFPQGKGKPSNFIPLTFSLWMPLFPWNVPTRILGFVVMASLLLLTGYFMLRYMIGKIYALPSFFHRSHENNMNPVPTFSTSLEHLIVIGPAGLGKSSLAMSLQPACSLLNLHDTYGKDSWAEHMVTSLQEQTAAVIVDHFEYQWENLTHRKEKGVLLECLLARGIKICIFSTRDPLEWTRPQSVDFVTDKQDLTHNYWIDLLGTFGFTHFIPSRMERLLQEWLHPHTESAEDTGPVLPVKNCLYHEALPTLHLMRIGKWIRSYQEWATWTPSQMKEQFLKIGWPYYQNLWQSCSLAEKITLYHIAVDGYVHTDNPDLTALSQKGLIQLTPDLQLMNESFRYCILQLGANFQLSQLEKHTRPDTWGKLKWPFLIIFVIVLLFFFFTQQEFKNSFITLISLLPILLPAIPELPGLLAGTKKSQVSPS